MAMTNISLFVICVAILGVVLGSFDCRRNGQFCQNGGTCPDTNSICSCVDGFGGYDCSYNTTLKDIGACNITTCENGGTCIETEPNKTTCICAPSYYGESCNLKRYQLTCNSGNLLIGINPHGNFSGLVYVEDKRGQCEFEAVGESNQTKGWMGLAKTVKNEDEACGVINATFSPPNKENSTDPPANQTTAYTRVVYVVYERNFLTTLDEVLTFTCLFSSDSVSISKVQESDLRESQQMNKDETVGTLSPVQFAIRKSGEEKDKVTLGDPLTLSFTLDSTSFDAARLESCVFNDSVNASLPVIENSCVNDEAKSILQEPISYKDDNQTITIEFKIRVFKFVQSYFLGIVCKVKACPLGHGNRCNPRSCTDDMSNQIGYGRRKRSTDNEGTTEVGRILVVDFSGNTDSVHQIPVPKTPGTVSTPTCSMAKEVTAILAALGTVTLVLLVVTIVLMSRAVIMRDNSKTKNKDGCSETYSNLGQPRAFCRK